MIIAAFPLLFWNEGRAVERYKTLQEGAGLVVSVASAVVDAANEGKIVHVSGRAETAAAIADPVLGIRENAIRLSRKVEMYQWWERTTKETREKFGGGTETVTTYEYELQWSDRLIDSSQFKEQQGHRNPSRMPLESDDWRADQVNVGAFRLSSGLISQISGEEPLPVSGNVNIPASLGGQARLENGGIITGNPDNPVVGDLRITMTVVRPANVSVVASQRGDSLMPYQADAGGTIALLDMGTVSAEEMFADAELRNKHLTWLLRFVGFIVMFIGFRLLFRVLWVTASVVPFLGRIVSAGVGIISGLLAASLSLVTIAIAWIFYRPLLAIAILILAAVAAWFMLKRMRNADPIEPVGDATAP